MSDDERADANERNPGREIDPDDPFWDLEPAASGESDVSESVDEILYGALRNA